jgi:molecular chaperone GrpE (heat shock protein)
MRAVAAEEGGTDGEVLREVAPGYFLGDEILKFAEVIVGKEAGASDGQ